MLRVLPPASPPPFVVCDCVLHVPSSVHTHTVTLSSSLSFLASSRRSSPFGLPGLNDLNDGTSCVSADAHVRAGWREARSAPRPGARAVPVAISPFFSRSDLNIL